MRIDILSLFPDYFHGPFDVSIIGQARKRGILDIRLIDIREFADNRYRKVDDRTYGGGPGMVLMPQPVVKAVRSVKEPGSRVIYMSPQGATLTAAKCREIASLTHLVILCGHYEGIDQRALDLVVDEEISIGDYVLTDGCLPAIVLVNGVVRFIPGVIGHESATSEESFEKGIFDCPHYTRPEEFEGRRVPEVLLSGNHQEIAKWRKAQAIENTRRVRPDLIF
jgi:tRNA (guanine37-N1)-methyltransferase